VPAGSVSRQDQLLLPLGTWLVRWWFVFRPQLEAETCVRRVMAIAIQGEAPATDPGQQVEITRSAWVAGLPIRLMQEIAHQQASVGYSGDSMDQRRMLSRRNRIWKKIKRFSFTGAWSL
jgi:hypothetical protein